jgi:hypothetical protein
VGPAPVRDVEEDVAVEEAEVEVGRGTTNVAICHKGKGIIAGAPTVTTQQRTHGDVLCQNAWTVSTRGGVWTVSQGAAECACHDAGGTAEEDLADREPDDEPVEAVARSQTRFGKGGKGTRRRARRQGRRAEKVARSSPRTRVSPAITIGQDPPVCRSRRAL